MAAFKKEYGDWTEYRKLSCVTEIDFHFNQDGPSYHDYYESMEAVRQTALDNLKRAYEGGKINYVLFTHGWSTSRRGSTTSRSVIRAVMRSPDATPYIDRKRCIQHDSVFVAAIRKPKPK